MKEKLFNLFRKQPSLKYLILVSVVSIGVFFVITSGARNHQEEEIIEEVFVEEEYPLFTGNSGSTPDILAHAAFSIYYSENGKESVLYEKNSDEELAIASISKLMTALVAYQNYEIGDEVRVSERDIVSRTEFRDFRAFDETTINDMLHQVIIESNNSAAYAMGLISDRYLISDSEAVESFVNKMNQTAKDIGLKKTNFVNPSGLDTQTKYNSSTAEEVATLTHYIINNKPIIMDISTMPSYKVYSPDKSIYYHSVNTNMFLHSQNNEWQTLIIGGKTGYTRAANGCLVIVLDGPGGDGHIINVILGADDRFQEMEKLVNYIFDHYQF